MGAVGVSGVAASAGGAPPRTAAVHAAGAGNARAGQAPAPAGIDPFEVRVADAELEDLGRRLQSPRWPPDSPGEPWSYGTDRVYLEELIAYWRDEYDWRAHGAALVGIPLRAHPPRSFLSEPADNVTHWTVYDTGGHFPAIEEPALLVEDLRTFFRPLHSR